MATHTKNVRVVSTQSKADLARNIFNKMHGKKPRKEVLDAFVEQAGLTPSGASSYYQRFSQGSVQSTRASRRVANTTAQHEARPRGRPIDESSKAGIARSIFARMGGKKPRKEVIETLIKEAHLTQAGASTYYQHLKTRMTG